VAQCQKPAEQKTHDDAEVYSSISCTAPTADWLTMGIVAITVR